MKAIILAAGMGTRLGKYTEDLPKCMLSFNGKTLIERQVETLRDGGITDITLVTGYMAHKIIVTNTKKYINKEFASTNMVETLFCAESELKGNDEVLICYADIIYEQKVLTKVMQSKAEIGVVVDEDYLEYWKVRMDNPTEDMESLVIDDEGKIIDLGNTGCNPKEATVRYIGLIKLSKEGIRKFIEIYNYNKIKYGHLVEPWLRSKSFKKAYMTCMLQSVINSGYRVEPIFIQRGWLEFDTTKDYEQATEWSNTGKIRKFINLDATKVSIKE